MHLSLFNKFRRGLLVLGMVLSLLSPSLAQNKMSLVIGIDGLGYGTNGFSIANTPNIDGLINGTWQTGYRGAYSDDAFAGGSVGTSTAQATSSGPGWSTILSGVWVDQHNVPNNSFSNPDFGNNNTYFQTLEEGVSGFHSESIINWSPIDTHIISTVSDGSSAMDFRSTPGNDNNVKNTAVTRLNSLNTNLPSAMFIHFDEVDGAGHGGGSNSTGYKNEIEGTDGLVGELLAAVSGRTNFDAEDWQIIVTSDHGHRSGGGHGGQSALERTIPFVVSSKTLNQGDLDLTVLPGETPLSHADVSPTVLEHFGFSIPGQYAGVSRASGSLASVPEPGSSLVLTLAGLAAFSRRRRFAN